MHNRKFDRLERTKKWPTAWLLLAILVFVFQPLGTGLFCHQDAAHDHASHEHPTTTHHDDRPQTDAASQHESHSHEALIKTTDAPEHSDDSCCQVESAPVVAAVAASFTFPISKLAASPPHFAVISQVVLLEVAPAIQSRCGPLIPSAVSQLRRSSLLDRAPPLSA